VTRVLLPDADGIPLLGNLPVAVEVAVWDGTGTPAGAEAVEFWVPPFLGSGQAEALAQLPALKVVQLLSAGADAWVDLVPHHVTLCDARGVHSSATSEWAATAILASLRDFPRFAVARERGEWDHVSTDELAGKRVLIVGAGAIGEALEARLIPFEVELTRVARSPRPGVHSVGELPDLLPNADVVVLLVPLTGVTRGMVDAAFLARMSDGALLVNAARGPVVVTDALVAEVQSGRLRAALDVTDPEPLPDGHPLWTAPGVLLTPHVAGSVRGLLPRAYALVADQLSRYTDGRPLANVVSDGY